MSITDLDIDLDRLRGGGFHWHSIGDDEDDATQLGLADAIFATRDRLILEQSAIRDRWRHSAQFYLDREVMDPLLGKPFDFRLQEQPRRKPSWNACYSIPEALIGHLTLHDPMPKLQTGNAPFETQFRAQKKERFIVANIKAQRLSRKRQMAQRISYLYGLGWLKVFPQGGEVKVKVYRPDQVTVDDRTSSDELPLVSFHTDFVERGQLRGLYKDAPAEVITAAPDESKDGGFTTEDRVEVVEAVIRARPGAMGRRVSCTRAGVLHDDRKWKKEHAWLVPVRAISGIGGYHGEPLTWPIWPIQRSINYALMALDDNMRMVGHGFASGASAKNSEKAFTNTPFRVVGPGDISIHYPPFGNEHHYAHPQVHFKMAFEILGMNELWASAAPPGMNQSAVSLRTHNQIQSKRYAEHEENLDAATVAAAEMMIDAGGDIDRRGAWNVRGSASDFVKSVPWKDVSLKADMYVVEVGKTSSLPHDPSARRAELESAMRAGLVDRDTAQRLLGWNDLEKERTLHAAPFELLQSIFEEILVDGSTEHRPHPFHRLETAILMGVNYWSRAHVNGTPSKNIDALEVWIKEARAAMEPPQEEDMPPVGDSAIPGGLAADPAAAAQLAQAAAIQGGAGPLNEG